MIGPFDRAFTRRDVIEERLCLGLHVYQDGASDGYPWAAIHVMQDLRGRATKQLLEGSLEMWVYPAFLHGRQSGSGHPKDVFGVEINDRINILRVVISDQPNQVYHIERHRIVIVSTPLNIWSYRSANRQTLPQGRLAPTLRGCFDSAGRCNERLS